MRICYLSGTRFVKVRKYFLDFIFPENLLDYFELVRMEEKPISGESKLGLDKLYQSELHIYLDERDNRSADDNDLHPNGFTESSQVEDFSIRDRKVLLHIRRRRWLDKDGKSVLSDTCPLCAKGTRLSTGLASFLKGNNGLLSGYRSLIGPDLLRRWRQSGAQLQESSE